MIAVEKDKLPEIFTEMGRKLNWGEHLTYRTLLESKMETHKIISGRIYSILPTFPLEPNHLPEQ